MRVELKDFVDYSPLISAVVAYFIDPPKLDFDLTKTANIADHPWISTTVRKEAMNSIVLTIEKFSFKSQPSRSLSMEFVRSWLIRIELLFL